MAIPQTRKEFGQYCLRKLGAPVIQINVADEQVDDRIDEALIFFSDYHFEGSERIYFKYLVIQNNFPDSIYNVNVVSAGTLYSNSDTFSFIGEGNRGVAANGTIVTDGTGAIVNPVFTDNGEGFATDPTITINTSTGSGGQLKAELGGFIQLPNTVIGITELFDLGLAESSVNNLFNIRYQIALNDLYMLNNLWMPDYYIVRQNIALIEEVLIGKQPIRFNRYKNRLFLDMDWKAVSPNTWVVMDAYTVVDPEKHPQVWSDRWLQRYTTSLIKEQWGSDLKKYGNLALVGGVTLNGQQIYNEAIQEKQELEYELYNSWSLPPAMMMG